MFSGLTTMTVTEKGTVSGIVKERENVSVREKLPPPPGPGNQSGRGNAVREIGRGGKREQSLPTGLLLGTNLSMFK